MAKDDEVKKAAENRHEIDKQRVEDENQNKPIEKRFDETELGVLKESAQQMADAKPQSAHGTIDGKIDIEAMGDVKGDGGDAKNYADDDPDKAKGVPTYEHGLHEIKAGENVALPRETRISERTLAEQDRGAEVAKGHADARSRAVSEDTKATKSKKDTK